MPTERSAIGAVARLDALRAEAYVEEALRWLPEGRRRRGCRPAGRGAASLAPGKTDGARILVADDNADMRDYVRRCWERAGTSRRWQMARRRWTRCARRKPDLLLTDVMMPGLDGVRLLRALRGDPDLRDLPVILLSARAGEEARVKGLDAGADDYLIKPFSARELVARVNANLEMARIRREATRDLRESEARFRNMADNAPVMMWMTDADGRAHLSQSRLDRIHRPDASSEALGFGAWEALHPEDREPAATAYSSRPTRRGEPIPRRIPAAPRPTGCIAGH